MDDARLRTWAARGLIVAGVGGACVALDGSLRWTGVRVLAIGAAVALAASLVQRARSPTAIVVALVGGAVAGSVGAGMAIPWLAAGVHGVRTFGAVLALLGGLVTLGVGLALAWRAVPGWRRALGAVVLAALAYATCVPIVIAVAATNVPRADLGSRTPADVGLVYRRVTFPARDGVLLAGWYLPSRNGAAIAVVPGASSTRSNVLGQAEVLARHGYGVLLFDPRGMGESAGRAMNLGWYGDEDLAGAVTYLARRPEVDPERIGALGESMGGEEVLGAIGRDRRLRAVVAEGATGRVAQDQDWLSDAYGLRGWAQRGVNRVTYGLTDLLTSADPPSPLRRTVSDAAPRPVLLITAGAVDEEASAAANIRAAAPSSVSVWNVPGAGHIHGLSTDPAAWERTVTGFLDHALAPARR